MAADTAVGTAAGTAEKAATTRPGSADSYTSMCTVAGRDCVLGTQRVLMHRARVSTLRGDLAVGVSESLDSATSEPPLLGRPWCSQWASGLVGVVHDDRDLHPVGDVEL